ncbi:MAG: tectonin domain-containing protein [Terriglobales bacterium]
MSRTNARFALCLLLICSAAAVPASAQHFQQMTGSLTQIAAGRAEVWGLNGSQPYRFDASTKKFVKISDKISGPLAQIAVGGGSLLEPDQVWGINASGLVYQYNFTTKAFVYVTGGIECKLCLFDSWSQLVVGEGDEDAAAGGSDGCHPYEVWGLQSNLAYQGLPYRYNWCEGAFDQIPLPGSSTTPFTHLATGGSDTWALDANAHIWHYNQYDNLWFQVTNGGFDGTLQQITVGVNDVWGLDGNGTVYRYDPNNATFVLIQPGSQVDVAQIAASGDGVWAITASSASSGLCNVSRFQSYGLGTPTAGGGGFQSFCLSTSSSEDATQIAVGSGAGIWVVNQAGQINTWVRP